MASVTVRRKIVKDGGLPVDELEEQVAQVCAAGGAFGPWRLLYSVVMHIVLSRPSVCFWFPWGYINIKIP